MGWFTKGNDVTEDKEEFLHVLKHGESSMRSEFEHALDLVREGCDIKRRLQGKVEERVTIRDGEHLIIYDMDHHRCEDSTVGYCATVRNYRSTDYTAKEPCIWCKKMI